MIVDCSRQQNFMPRCQANFSYHLKCTAKPISHTISSVCLGTLTEFHSIALAINSNLRRVSMSVDNVDQLQLIAYALSNPACLLEEIKISFYPTLNIHMNDLRRIVDALRRNSSLRALRCITLHYGLNEDGYGHNEDETDQFD
jgi:hypothetical protein